MKTSDRKTIKILGERNISLNLDNTAHHAHITKIGKALSSPIRLQMMNLLKINPTSLLEISEAMGLPVSSTALHIKCLEDARLIITESQPGIRGSMRVCLCTTQSIHIDAAEQALDQEDKTITVEMPVGNFYQWEVEPTCGLADENGSMDTYDNPKSFYSPYRMNAQLVWFQQGYVEYRFPNHCDNHILPEEISFSLELCSEAPGYMENWPSDITISINNQELGIYRSPGDFGSRHGLLTPAVWQHGRTQYGLLKTFSVRKNGGYIDGVMVNPKINIENLNLNMNPFISLKIEIKSDAEHIGGINIFGEKYGDFKQGIIMRIIY